MKLLPKEYTFNKWLHAQTMSNDREYKHIVEVGSFIKHLTFLSHILVLTVIHGFQVLVAQLKDLQHRAEVRSM